MTSIYSHTNITDDSILLYSNAYKQFVNTLLLLYFRAYNFDLTDSSQLVTNNNIIELDTDVDIKTQPCNLDNRVYNYKQENEYDSENKDSENENSENKNSKNVEAQDSLLVLYKGIKFGT
ncbi:hypothetical protein F8M41_008066 [Gigaspora margarita]|uniref:Uncharacterized protein n=1 Tax=Gigaspora margarita TaxID=4874 RepID=A0A8H4AVX0_GIGMA|nr:hypothetical protein F8M41_008066 [Gigaspora margarita]